MTSLILKDQKTQRILYQLSSSIVMLGSFIQLFQLLRTSVLASKEVELILLMPFKRATRLIN